jgi:hypothetical protein
LREYFTAISPIIAIANKIGRRMIASIPVFANAVSTATGAFGLRVETSEAVVAGTTGATEAVGFKETASTLIIAEALSTALVGERH